MKNQIYQQLYEFFTELNKENESLYSLVTDIKGLENSLERIKDDFGFIFLLDICAIDNLERNKQHSKRFEVIYHFLNMEYMLKLRVKIPLDEEERLPTLKRIWRNAEWFEREIFDLMGLNFNDVFLKRLFLPGSYQGHPLRKDFSHKHFKLENENSELYNINHNENISPLVFGLNHGVEVWVNSVNQTIKHTNLQVGFNHRGIEKKFESKSCNQIIADLEDFNLYSSPISAMGWCRTVEELLNCSIPDRAKGIRMIISEFSRITDHLNCLDVMGRNLGAILYHEFCFNYKIKIIKLIEKYCGSSLKTNIFRLGGVAYDLPSGWISDSIELLKNLKEELENYNLLLVRSKDWIEKTRFGGIAASEAIEWGFTGPCLRAAGVNYDVRKANPFYFYEQVDFDVVVGSSGDCYDRFLVRLEEIFQSIKIISQVLDNLPPGKIRTLDFLPSQGQADAQTICHELKTIDLPKGEIYSSIETANGELGYYLLSEGGRGPYRLKLGTPSFSYIQSVPMLLKDRTQIEACAILSSLNIIMSEVDK